MISDAFGAQPTTIDEYDDWNTEQLSRQVVSRRAVLGAVVAGAGGLAAAQFKLASTAFAAGGGVPGSTSTVVSGRHLSFVQGRGGRPDTAMAVTAQLVNRDGMLPRRLRAFVELGTEPGRYGQRVEAEIVHLTGQYAIPGGPVSSQFYAKARLQGLRPDTVYHYRLRLSDGATSGSAYFTTAPVHRRGRRHDACDVPVPFTFTAFADVGTNSARSTHASPGARTRRACGPRAAVGPAASSTTTTTTRLTRWPAWTPPTRGRRSRRPT